MRRVRFTPEERRSILRKADKGESVTRLCIEHGISRTLFYRWRDRFLMEGMPGLHDRPPLHKSDAVRTPPELVSAITWAARDHPYLGCRDIAKLISAASLSVSFSKVQKVLHAHGLGSKEQRWLSLEDAFRKGYSNFSKRQLAFIIARNPNFRERHLRTYRPRENLSAAIFNLQPRTGLSRTTFVAVIDAYSSFAYVDAVERPRDAHAVVAAALTYFAASGNPGRYLFTDRSPAFSYRNSELAAALKPFSIQHIASSAHPRGFVEQLRLWLAAYLRDNPVSDANEVRIRVFATYNAEHAPQGFPNYGLTPAAIFRDGVSTMIKHKPNPKSRRL